MERVSQTIAPLRSVSKWSCQRIERKLEVFRRTTGGVAAGASAVAEDATADTIVATGNCNSSLLESWVICLGTPECVLVR